MAWTDRKCSIQRLSVYWRMWVFLGVPLVFLPVPVLFPEEKFFCAYIVLIMVSYWVTEVRKELEGKHLLDW